MYYYDMKHCRNILLSASEERLAGLIEERLRPGTDKAAIDERIWDLFGEEWAVIFTDLSGFSRKVKTFGIIHFLQVIHESERILVPVIDANDGILLKIEGDSMLMIFRKPEKALKAAVEMQHVCQEYNLGKEEEDQILLCLGIGYGKMLRIGDADVFGREVNSASKLGEDVAKADEILVTKALVEAIGMRPSFIVMEDPPAAAGPCYRYEYK